jgi:DNA-directed RNA polymerase specialized sigma24 family protein
MTMDDAEKKELRERALAEADWEALVKSTAKFAYGRLRGRFKQQAHDVAQSAAEKVWGKKEAWDIERVPKLEDYLREVANTLAWNLMTRSAEVHRADDGEAAIAHAKDGAPSPESVVNGRELLNLCTEELVAQFKQEGADYLSALEDVPEEQAEKVGLTKPQMYRLRYKAAQYCKEVLRQPYLDSKGLVVEGAHGADPAPELSAEIAAMLEQPVYAASRRRKRIFVTRIAFAASMLALVCVAIWLFTRH